MNLLDLSCKPLSEQFSIEEIEFLKSKISKNSYRVYYAIYKPVSKQNKNVTLIYDSNPFARRRSGVMNQWDIISKRNINNIEYQELIENYGSNNRRFLVYYFKSIEILIDSENDYNIIVPDEFINICKEKKYSSSIQLSLFKSN